MAKRLSAQNKVEILNLFVDSESTIDDLSKKFECTKDTIIRNLKKTLGKEKYQEIYNSNYEPQHSKSLNKKTSTQFNENEKTESIVKEEISDPLFVELTPLDYEIDSNSRKELSSVSISDIDFPKVVYMVVDKKIELEIKFLKDFPQWDFLSTDDLNRKTIEIFFDLNLAKRSCSKEQKVLKVPNTDVFRIAAPVLLGKGISRIVCAENLIAL